MAEIALTSGEVAFVDDEDLSMASQYRWSPSRVNGVTRYAMTGLRDANGARRTLYMHQLIADAPKGLEVDHINRNKLDNRKENLRVVSHSVNTHNRKDNAGVNKPAGRNKWKAIIYVNNERHYLGSFDTEEAARAAYQEAKINHGLIPPAMSWPVPSGEFPRNGERPARFDEKEHTP